MTFETRFARRAAAAGPGFDNAVLQRFGFDAKGVSTLLAIGSRLSQPSGGQLTSADAKALKALHQNTAPGFIDSVVDAVNKLPPGRRFDAFAGLLADDGAGYQGDHANSTARFKEISELQRAFTTHEYAEAVDRKLGGSAVAKPAWKAPEGSVRGLIEKQMASKGLDRVYEAFEAGDPHAESAIRNHIADRIDDAADRLEKPGDSSMRDTVEAAFDLHAGEAVAAETFGIGERT